MNNWSRDLVCVATGALLGVFITLALTQKLPRQRRRRRRRWDLSAVKNSINVDVVVERGKETSEVVSAVSRCVERCVAAVPVDWGGLLSLSPSVSPILTRTPSLRRSELSTCSSSGGDDIHDDWEGFGLSVLTLNMLADGLSGNCDGYGGFTEVNLPALQWENRKHRLLEEVARSGADIVTLQEVDHFNDFFEAELGAIGYSGVYREDIFSPCQRAAVEGQRHLRDGVAVFFKRDRLELIERHVSPSHLSSGGDEGGKTVILRLRIREGGAERLALEVQRPWARRLVNGEIPFHTRGYALPTGLMEPSPKAILVVESPEGGLDRWGLGEATIVGEVSFSECHRCRGSTDGGPPVRHGEQQFSWTVERAIAYEETLPVTKGALRREFRSFFHYGGPPEIVVATTHLAAKKNEAGAAKRERQMRYLLGEIERRAGETTPVILAGDFNAVPSEPCIDLVAESSLGLTSAFSLKQIVNDAMFSSWKIRTGNFKAGEHKYWIDYIFFTRSRGLSLVSTRAMPTEADIGPKALPCERWPSDHLSLQAEFQLV